MRINLTIDEELYPDLAHALRQVSQRKRGQRLLMLADKALAGEQKGGVLPTSGVRTRGARSKSRSQSQSPSSMPPSKSISSASSQAKEQPKPERDVSQEEEDSTSSSNSEVVRDAPSGLATDPVAIDPAPAHSDSAISPTTNLDPPPQGGGGSGSSNDMGGRSQTSIYRPSNRRKRILD